MNRKHRPACKHPVGSMCKASRKVIMEQCTLKWRVFHSELFVLGVGCPTKGKFANCSVSQKSAKMESYRSGTSYSFLICPFNGRGGKYCIQFVCVSVSVYACMFYVCSLAYFKNCMSLRMVWSSSDNNASCYIVPVLWLTLHQIFQKMGHIHRYS